MTRAFPIAFTTCVLAGACLGILSERLGPTAHLWGTWLCGVSVGVMLTLWWLS